MCAWARLGARSGQENPRFHYQPVIFRRCELEQILFNPGHIQQP